MGGGVSSTGGYGMEVGMGLFPSTLLASDDGADSLEEGADEMLARFQAILGRTITALQFPGFHSLTEFAVNDEDENDGGGGEKEMIVVRVGFQILRLSGDVTVANEDGWNALHSCCHSTTTAEAGMQILKVYARQGGDIDAKTIRGPGSFNSGWTPLHMASGYGVLPLVRALLDEGANPNTQNSFTWTPLLEACHKGFIEIARALVERGADVDYLPNEKAATAAHFLRGPPQSALGEACRCGHVGIARILLEAGADKNKANGLGWTSLHEAAFYNHPELVQLLLVHGADATIKNSVGALPFHLANSGAAREAIKDLAPPEACTPPPAGPTFVMSIDENGQMYISQVNEKQEQVVEERKGASPTKSRSATSKSPPRARQQKDNQGGEPKLLHSGGVLGDLPVLQPRTQQTDDKVQHKKGGGRRAESRKHSSQRMLRSHEEDEAPPKYICELSKRMMVDPVSSPYGNIYDRSLIELWLQKQGSIDPLTGQPLVSSQLRSVPGLREEIKTWRSGGDANVPIKDGLEDEPQDENDGPAIALGSDAVNMEGDADDIYEF